MDKELEERIRRAVTEGRKVRSAYYAMIDLPDEQQLGPPAFQAKLVELENRFGKPLPLSYRTFLSLYDGWRMVDGAMDLLSVREMLEGPREASIRKWKRQALEAGDFIAANSLVIGVSEITPTKLLLDPQRVDAKGEWAVVQHHKVEEYTYTSFLVWLEESVDEFRELLREESESDLA
jgi:hypothetical protein